MGDFKAHSYISSGYRRATVGVFRDKTRAKGEKMFQFGQRKPHKEVRQRNQVQTLEEGLIIQKFVVIAVSKDTLLSFALIWELKMSKKLHCNL